MMTRRIGHSARLARAYGLETKSTDIWNHIEKDVQCPQLLLAALLWASLLQLRITLERGEKSPHESVGEYAKASLLIACSRQPDAEELRIMVSILHRGWRYGDALRSWHSTETGTKPAPVEIKELPRRRVCSSS